jgi:hypothetical protein
MSARSNAKVSAELTDGIEARAHHIIFKTLSNGCGSLRNQRPRWSRSRAASTDSQWKSTRRESGNRMEGMRPSRTACRRLRSQSGTCRRSSAKSMNLGAGLAPMASDWRSGLMGIVGYSATRGTFITVRKSRVRFSLSRLTVLVSERTIPP